jgi:hypothetical protein
MAELITKKHHSGEAEWFYPLEAKSGPWRNKKSRVLEPMLKYCRHKLIIALAEINSITFLKIFRDFFIIKF